LLCTVRSEVNGQDLILYEIVEIRAVNLELSDYRLMAEICYCSKLCEFATTTNPRPLTKV